MHRGKYRRKAKLDAGGGGCLVTGSGSRCGCLLVRLLLIHHLVLELLVLQVVVVEEEVEDLLPY